MRMFVAVTVPDQAAEDLAEFLGPRQEAGPELRWTVPEQWHLTLAFLPDVADRHLDELVERLARAASRRTAHRVRLQGGGAFPDPVRAKVLFAALDGHEPALEEVDRLATGARAAASKSGTEVQGGRFHPHLTLARAARPVQATRWLRILDAYTGPEWPVAEVVLVASHLGEGPRRRPRHEVVETFPVGSAASG